VWIRERIQKHQRNRAAAKFKKESMETPAAAQNEADSENNPEDIKKD
jgi:hypothetical protein